MNSAHSRRFAAVMPVMLMFVATAGVVAALTGVGQAFQSLATPPATPVGS